jgi:hypothetical protein
MFLHRRLNPPAPIVTANDHMLDFEDIHRILENREAIHVRMDNQVRHITVNKQLSGKQADDLIRRDSAVRTTDPKEFR